MVLFSGGAWGVGSGVCIVSTQKLHSLLQSWTISADLKEEGADVNSLRYGLFRITVSRRVGNKCLECVDTHGDRQWSEREGGVRP